MDGTLFMKHHKYTYSNMFISNQNTKQKRKRKWKKYNDKYRMKMKMKKKLALMIFNLTRKECQTHGNKSTTRNKGTNRIPIMIRTSKRKLMKKKKVPNEWPDHPT